MLGAETFLSLEDQLQYAIRFIDCVKVNGKAKEVMIYECLDAETPEMKKKKQATIQIFEEAIALYQSQEYQNAHQLFQDCCAKNPLDRAALIYLERCKNILSGRSIKNQDQLNWSVA